MRTRVAVLACAALLAGIAPAAGAAAEETPLQPRTRTDATVQPAAALPVDHGHGHLPSIAPVADDALSDALAEGTISQARYALERARSVFTPRRVERRYGDVAAPDPREATLILRDLALRTDRLSPTARDDAHRLLARPTDGSADPVGTGYRTSNTASFCSTHMCYHWAQNTSDAPPLLDLDGDAVPDWVESTATEFERVWRVEIGSYGYRAPKSDISSTNNGGDERLDVYLADTGADNLYGYCATDDPDKLFIRDVSAYCVVDNNFTRAQFAAPPLNSLRVTAAHEFFHTVQFAYDIGEDLWLLEGTATWIEDEVYDSVNDNYQYLPGSALTHPHLPLDFGVYGPWIFFRFMAEYFGTATTDQPAVVRQIWERADAAPGAPDDYSLQAVARVSSAHRVPFRRLFADFGWTGPFAAGAYAEGRNYPKAPMTRSFTLTASAPGIAARAVTLHHLANRHITLRPGRSLPAQRRLRVSLNLPDRARGSEATVTVHRRDGVVRPFAATLNASGNGTTTVGFSRTRVARVVLTLTNASTRMRCGRGTPLSCAGGPLDDGLRFGYSTRSIR